MPSTRVRAAASERVRNLDIRHNRLPLSLVVEDLKQLALLFLVMFAAAFWSFRTAFPTNERVAETPLAWHNPAIRLILEPPDEHIAMPLWSVRVRQIGNTWHALRSGRRRHEGQDIFAPVGTPVYSATVGILIRIGDRGKGGNAISVLGAGGRVYYYAHLDRFAEHLQVGGSVSPETVIGYVGKTGNARTTPAHLHFGVYDAEGAINPLPLLVNRTAARGRQSPPKFIARRRIPTGRSPARAALRGL